MPNLYDNFIESALDFSLEQSDENTREKAEDIVNELKDKIEKSYPSFENMNASSGNKASLDLFEINKVFNELVNIKIEPQHKIDIATMSELIKSTTDLLSSMGTKVINANPVTRPDLNERVMNEINILKTHKDTYLAIQNAIKTLMDLDDLIEKTPKSQDMQTKEIKSYFDKLMTEIEYTKNKLKLNDPSISIEIPVKQTTADTLKFEKETPSPVSKGSLLSSQMQAREQQKQKILEETQLKAAQDEINQIRKAGLFLIENAKDMLLPVSAPISSEKKFASKMKELLNEWANIIESSKELKELNTLLKTITPIISGALDLNQNTIKAAKTLENINAQERFKEINILYDNANKTMPKLDGTILSLLNLQTSLAEAQEKLTQFTQSLPLSIVDLKKLSNKTDGKNVDPINGSYESLLDGNKYFIKKPDDPREFFTELFAGLVITGLTEKNFIPKHYQDTLIPAKEILLEDKTFGLIQPYLEFTPLHHLLGNNRGDKKFVLGEVIKKGLKGQGYEDIVQENTELHGLSFALMMKLFLADYSIHDGNIGVKESVLEENADAKKKLYSFIGFDFGAALRAISSTENSENIYTSLEEKNRFFNFYKKYPTLYANMPDVYVKVGQHASDLNNSIQNRAQDFYLIIKDAAERSFNSFKANFGQDEKAWKVNRDHLINYIYTKDENLTNILDLNDNDMPIKLAADMRRFFIERSNKLSVDAAPQPLNKSRVKRYNSISGPSGEFDEAVRKRSEAVIEKNDSTAGMLQQLNPDHDHTNEMSFDALLSKDDIRSIDAYTPPSVTTRVIHTENTDELNAKIASTPIKGH
ncbi:MAG: hypothetical protein P4M12_08810 [Gammaproteobacteria bacterium]|nr:hypothetical protein [Gammaproteobacteria bacterium]